MNAPASPLPNSDLLARRTTVARRLRGFVLLALAVLLIGLPISVYSAGGDPDPTFGREGKVLTTFEGIATAMATAVQGDGKLIVAGSVSSGERHDFRLTRYTPAGLLDSSFGGTGSVRLDFRAELHGITAMVILADGRIVVAGYVESDGNRDVALARFNNDGSLDPSFGTSGKVVADVAGVNAWANALAVQTDGKLVVASSDRNAGVSALLRFGSDGTPDPAFGTGGQVLTNGYIATSLVIQPDGKTVVAGSSRQDDTHGQLALVRYNADGSLDSSFGDDGIVTTVVPYSADNVINAVTLQADGKLVVAGNSDSSRFVVARYSSDGALDPTFAEQGMSVIRVNGFQLDLQSIVIQADGKLVAAGRAWGVAGPYTSDDFVLLRYNPDGSLDPTFDGDGIASADFYRTSDTIRGVAIQPDGRLVAMGNVGGNYGLLRFNADGSRDPSFGDLAGFVLTDFGHAVHLVDLAVQPDDKLVAVGRGFEVARYLEDGSLDPSFDGDGRAVLGDEIFGQGAMLSTGALAIQEGVKVVVAGSVNWEFGMIRYNGDGSVDSSFGSDGGVLTDFEGSGITDLAILPGGNLLAVGFAQVGPDRNIAVARYTEDGSLDSSFGDEGRLIDDFAPGMSSSAAAVALGADGAFVLAGTVVSDTHTQFALARYNGEGSLDASFGDDGRVITAFPGCHDAEARALAIQADGKIVAAGSCDLDLAVARYNADGSLDTAFGGDGRVTTDYVYRDDAADVAIQSDGKILVVGTTSGPDRLLLVRYSEDGSLDPEFGEGGVITKLFLGFQHATGSALVLDTRGRIVAGGSAFSTEFGGRYPRIVDSDFAIARYEGDVPGERTRLYVPIVAR